jgi:hypothetical protein
MADQNEQAQQSKGMFRSCSRDAGSVLLWARADWE